MCNKDGISLFFIVFKNGYEVIVEFLLKNDIDDRMYYFFIFIEYEFLYKNIVDINLCRNIGVSLFLIVC